VGGRSRNARRNNRGPHSAKKKAYVFLAHHLVPPREVDPVRRILEDAVAPAVGRFSRESGRSCDDVVDLAAAVEAMITTHD
jgi:hypothetical protein